jgi:lipid A 4'-phosphatase
VDAAEGARNSRYNAHRMNRFVPAALSARNVGFVLVGLAGLTGLVFAVAPGIDLAVAGFFHGIAVEETMPRLSRAIAIVRRLEPLVTTLAIAPAVVVLLVKLFWPKRTTIMPARAALFLSVSLVLGPGLLVNTILKDHWARPRPGMVANFGGDMTFRPWWDPRGACTDNCSFVSGETSSAVWLTAPALLVPLPWRYAALAGVAVYAAGIGVMRLLLGGHFLSDVLFAAIFTGLVIWTVHGRLLRWRMPPTDARIDAALERIGSALRRAGAAVVRSVVAMAKSLRPSRSESRPRASVRSGWLPPPLAGEGGEGEHDGDPKKGRPQQRAPLSTIAVSDERLK